ncbi:MAG TPA: sn-glycerol-3-phosphate ABC transporter ATP-binding protein UgpC [Ensifer sp.]|jgi:ABC-type sugar transport system ATPase subunit|uniref:ABC transporter ATP-binding protein n=1 Tax=Ensifer sp. TaxID=1872086 RepID=UPI002E0D7BF0|nr:sn-glycerol-3-phosphate ABC transporter ATP-binding protein UgpC [Ensifer sp.]
MSGIALTNVVKRFGALTVIDKVNLTVGEGEFVVFVGPSGCGKSTLLRMIAGLEEISDGELQIGGERMNETPPARRGIAMVFQSYALYPHMNVERNLGFALETARLAAGEIKERVAKVARFLKIEHLLERRPAQLSGGQQQRVAIGRALVRSQKLFLFDEPLSNLDADLRMEMRVEIARIHRELKATTVYVTHDQLEAMTLADRIVVLKDGHISQVGTPMELYERPANKFVAGFIGAPRMNFLPGALVNGGGTSRLDVLNVAHGLGRYAYEGKVSVGIRPEDLMLDGGDIRLPATVQLVEPLGGEALVHARLGNGQSLVLKVQGRPDLAPNADISVGWLTSKAHIFGADDAALTAAGV